MLTTKEIMDIIPHRHPFLLVDTIDELEPGIKATAEPVMPGVLQIEACAQVGAVAILSLEENKGKTAYFGAVNNARFKRKVVPGDKLKMECEIIKKKGPVGVGKAVATVDGEVALTAELTFMVG